MATPSWRRLKEAQWVFKPPNPPFKLINKMVYNELARIYLEEKDKKLKASIAITDFDLLIRRSLEPNASESAVADAWKKISSGTLKPEVFLEKSSVMRKRLVEIIDRFGRDRIDLAGPECGLRGFPTYSSALKCLKNVSQATVLDSSSSSK